MSNEINYELFDVDEYWEQAPESWRQNQLEYAQNEIEIDMEGNAL